MLLRQEARSKELFSWLIFWCDPIPPLSDYFTFWLFHAPSLAIADCARVIWPTKQGPVSQKKKPTKQGPQSSILFPLALRIYSISINVVVWWNQTSSRSLAERSGDRSFVLSSEMHVAADTDRSIFSNKRSIFLD